MTALPEDNQSYYDLAVIGGGINGAAIARDAALRNLKVILFEKNDFGAGASSKTSKLAHGGVRYLEHLEFGLVKESLTERGLLLVNAPHLVKPLPFILPVYTNSPFPLWKVHLGLYIYDFLAYRGGMPNHQKLTSHEILNEVKGLKKEGLRGGCSFYDAQMLDNRIVIENILSAEQAGARVYNHTEVTELIHDEKKIQGVIFRNHLTGKNGQIRCKVLVNATGAWSAKIGNMEPEAFHCTPTPSKGVHLILPLITNTALLLHAPQDGRVFFILPWEKKYSLVGTTDTFYGENPDQLSVNADDKAYLLKALNDAFPEKHFNESSIISSFAGLRPLVSSDKENQSASDVTREHVIQVSVGGMITILGGKFTTHRLIAEEVVNKVVGAIKDKNFLPCSTKSQLLPGAEGEFSLFETRNVLQKAGIEGMLLDHLVDTYGVASLKILNIIKRKHQEKRQICIHQPHVFAEITYGVENEHVRTTEDWILRSSFMKCPICFPENEFKI